MQKNKTITVIAVMLSLFVLCSITPVHALSPGLYVNPGTITTPGDPTTITLATPVPATGTLKVKCVASGDEWTASINTGPSCQQVWTFPSAAFTGLTTPSTDTLGMYDVTADITMNIGKFVWKTTFMVEFFVIPDLPFGTIMAVVACFGAVAGYTKLKRFPVKSN